MKNFTSSYYFAPSFQWLYVKGKRGFVCAHIPFTFTFSVILI